MTKAEEIRELWPRTKTERNGMKNKIHADLKAINMKQAQEIEELKYKIQQLENEAIQIRYELSFSGNSFRKIRRLECAVGALADRVLELSAALGDSGLRDIDKKRGFVP